MKVRTPLARGVACAALFALPLSSHAIFRAYVSSTGSDANPCTVQQPCRLLPRALTAVDDGGEIWILDSANFNTAPVDIGKSVTIQAMPGVVGSVVTSGGNAIAVSANDVRVTLRNLSIGPFSGNAYGLSITGSNARVYVEKCTIAGLGVSGINMTGNSRLHVLDSVIRDNASHGIVVRNGVANVSRSHLLGHDAGVGFYVFPNVDSDATGHADNTVASGNGYGFAAVGGAGRVARLHVTRSVGSGNMVAGFYRAAREWTTRSWRFPNEQYGLRNVGATLRSAGNNRAINNGTADYVGDITGGGSY